jgi:putative ABC transport system permease protein
MIWVAIGALATGFILAPLALGVFLSYRILRFPDITVDGSFALGAVLAARMIFLGVEPISATAIGLLGGGVAGLCTGLLITRFGIEKLLAGILVMIALYSVNFLVLQQGSYSYNYDVTLYTYAQHGAEFLFGTASRSSVLGVEFSPVRLTAMLFSAAMAFSFSGLMFLFFRTRAGLAMRAAGANDAAIRALGANVSLHVTAVLAISNALAALSGAMFAQYYGTASINDGAGMIVTGLACVLIGEAFLQRRVFGVRLFGAILGAAIYMLIRSYILYTGLAENYFKFFTALIVLLALLLPPWIRRLRQNSVAQGTG